MELLLKRPDHIVPEYSLTGDLLSYSRCALQYRYYNGSALPPSRPVQMWYGEFIHGMLETGYRLWLASGATLAFPWPYTTIEDDARPEPPPEGLPAHDIRVIGWPIEEALMHQGKRARSRHARRAAYRRAAAAINMLGPHLFPLIADAEQKVVGTRLLPARAGEPALRSERYALHGVIDVLTHVELANAAAANVIRDAVTRACPDLAGTFEVIVDYKGARRPATNDRHWYQGEWQVQTYAWLRHQQRLARPVAAGILIYVNELAPSQDEIAKLKTDISRRRTDVAPARGDRDYYALETWTPGHRADLSAPFRLRRAIRVIPVNAASIARATEEFDSIVRDIEERVVAESIRGNIQETWAATCDDDETCVACDFRWFCRHFNNRGGRPDLPIIEEADAP